MPRAKTDIAGATMPKRLELALEAVILASLAAGDLPEIAGNGKKSGRRRGLSLLALIIFHNFRGKIS